MRVLVIGGTGFIGARVVRRLARSGHTVTVFHRGQTQADLPDDVDRLHGDRDRLTARADVYRDRAPDVVLDVIPYTQAQARQIVEVFGSIAGRVVAVSSADVYRNYDGFRGASDHAPDAAPLAEDAPLRETRFPYRDYDGLDFAYAEDYDKIRVEETLRSAPDLPATILRLPAVYGPGDRQHRFLPHLERMFEEQPAIRLSEAHAHFRWTHGYVENVAAAVAHATTDERAAGRIFNVGERETPTEAQRLRAIGEAAGWTGEVRALPPDELPDALKTPFDYRYSLATDTHRLREALDFTAPVARADALQRTLEWERREFRNER